MKLKDVKLVLIGIAATMLGVMLTALAYSTKLPGIGEILFYLGIILTLVSLPMVAIFFIANMIMNISKTQTVMIYRNYRRVSSLANTKPSHLPAFTAKKFL